MGKALQASSDPTFQQLKRYAKDLSKIYRSEREKQQALEKTNQQLIKFATDLGQTVADLKEMNRQLKQAYLDTIHRLLLAAEYKDQDTGDHIMRMGRYSALMAAQIGMAEADVENIRYAAPMHDIGKIGTPDDILLKPGKLSDAEFETMKEHTTFGAKILANSESEILQLAGDIALYHHEKWCGGGYPTGIAGTDIPIAARIVGLCDVFDALTTDRPYKDAYPVDVALSIVQKERGRQFDPELVDAFEAGFESILAIRQAVGAENEVRPVNYRVSERDLVAGTLQLPERTAAGRT